MDIDILEKLKNGSAGPSMKFFNLKYENNDNEEIDSQQIYLIGLNHKLN